ncbi:phage major capsid protein [Priestia sp. P5]|uniref:phage major capsid protein n=1 Tax=Priestia sp. P5 TaxID=2917806 RepID=UPI0024050CF5|nr:phage major capsid protein [Priestia sp. P5]MDG0062107.1 phage major capsid protein [Priestia sp. P5]
MKMELRQSQTQLTSDGDLLVKGYVNKTNTLSEMLGSTTRFKEKIAPGAFAKAIRNKSRDVDFLAEHDSKTVLASTRNDSLTLKEDAEGLYMEARISPTSYGKDWHVLISDGIVQSMSFGFRALKESWQKVEGIAIRTIHELELFEVSAVRNPAYMSSSISARGIDIIENISVPKEISEYSNNKEERNNMMEITEKRNNEFEQILKGETRSLQMTAQAGAIIPQNVHDEIILKMEETSPVFAKARKLQSVAGTLRVTRENDGVVAGFVGEGEALTEGQIGFEYVDLKQKRVGAAVSLSNQLINDSAVNIQDYVGSLLARRTGKAIEKSILVGTGNTEFAGIINDADIQAVLSTGTGAVLLDDLQTLYLTIHPDFLNGSSFTMSREFFNTIAKLKDNDGHFYLQMGVVNGAVQYTLFGLPVDVTDALPASTPVIFGNITEAYNVMIKQEAKLQEINDTTMALKGAKMFLFDFYADGAVVNPQAVVKLTVS